MKKKPALFFIFLIPLYGVLKGESYANLEVPPFENVLVTSILTDEGLYNLNISVDFKSPTSLASEYSLPTYELYLQALKKLWRKRLFKIVNPQILNVSDLSYLKKEVEEELEKLTTEQKPIFKVPQKAEVIFSITHFFLTKI